MLLSLSIWNIEDVPCAPETGKAHFVLQTNVTCSDAWRWVIHPFC
jgi:hypothetical protein